MVGWAVLSALGAAIGALARPDSGRSDLRNRAILWLFAVYGLRSGEVAGLRLSDLNWERHLLRVRRSKSNRVQE